MALILNRKKHDSAIIKDVVVCCKHANKFYVDMNGLLTDSNRNFFCKTFATSLHKYILLLASVVLLNFKNILFLWEN